MAFNPMRRELFEIMQQLKGASKQEKKDHVKLYVLRKRGQEISEDDSHVLSQFFCEMVLRLEKSKRSTEGFLAKNCSWLNEVIGISPANRHKTKGRPPKSFHEASDRCKRRKVEPLLTATASELAYAAQIKARKEGNEDSAKLIKEAALSSPDRPTKIRSAWKSEQDTKPILHFTADEALSLLIEAYLSVQQYKLLRAEAVRRNTPSMYLSYDRIVQAKRKCYPKSISATETRVEVILQELLDHTSERLVSLQEDVLFFVSKNKNEINLELKSKWGSDGSSGHSTYKQTFQDPVADDSAFNMTSLVPLQLFDANSGQIIWHNNKPSSTRFCRPLSIIFAKETKDLSLAEYKRIEDQISTLIPTEVTTSFGVRLRITHNLMCTMIDGKFCSVSAQRCCVCKATPKEMNNIPAALDTVNDDSTYKFGLSAQHAHIRFLECVLHIAYRLDVKCWAARSVQEKNSVAQRKTQIQKEFREQLGLLTDRPKQGSGTSHDGNTARRFFANPEVTASITGVDKGLVEMLGVILQTIACGFCISVEKFRDYCFNAATHYVSLYPWYFMPSSLHKILIHGADIIAAAEVPIGQLSQEAQESRNKDVRRFREFRARKCARTATNEDLLNRLLATSDLLLSSMKPKTMSSRKPIPDAVKSLLLPSETVLNAAVQDP